MFDAKGKSVQPELPTNKGDQRHWEMSANKAKSHRIPGGKADVVIGMAGPQVWLFDPLGTPPPEVKP
jgi:hypothetical protein